MRWATSGCKTSTVAACISDLLSCVSEATWGTALQQLLHVYNILACSSPSSNMLFYYKQWIIISEVILKQPKIMVNMLQKYDTIYLHFNRRNEIDYQKRRESDVWMSRCLCSMDTILIAISHPLHRMTKKHSVMAQCRTTDQSRCKKIEEDKQTAQTHIVCYLPVNIIRNMDQRT